MRSLHILLVVLVLMTGRLIAKAQTIEEIVTRHIEAIGGKDAWMKVNSLKIEGIIEAQGGAAKMSLVQLHGKGMRQDIEIQGVGGYQIVTQTQGWIFMPFTAHTEVTVMKEDDVKLAQNDLDIHGSLMDYKEKGHTAELVEKEKINGAECFKIILTLKSGKKETVYIDSKNYYVVRTSTNYSINGENQEIQTDYSSFEKIPEGIVMAKSLVLPYGTLTLNKIEVNKPVDEMIFNPAYNAK